MSDSTATGSPEMLTLEPNPDRVLPLSTSDFQRLKGLHPDLWENPEIECRTCGKAGKFRTLREGREVDVRCDCTAQCMLHQWLLNAGLGIAYQRLGWDSADGVSDGTKEKILSYLASPGLAEHGHGLTMWGPPGTGKTLLATLVQRELMALGYDAYFCLFNELISLHTSGWRSGDAKQWFERRIMNAGILVIDDIGKERMPQDKENFLNAMVDELLRRRIQHARATIVTTNMSPDMVEKRYYTGTLGLFSEVNDLIQIQAESYRETRRQQIVEAARRGLRFPVVVS